MAPTIVIVSTAMGQFSREVMNVLSSRAAPEQVPLILSPSFVI
jgi:hypothetical protein